MSADVVFSNASGGFLVLNMGVSVANASIADIGGFQFPSWIDPQILDFLIDVSTPPDGFPAPSFNLVVIDVNSALEGTISDKVLATLSLELLSPGETELRLDSIDLVDDDFGDPIVIDPISVKITVTQ